MTPHGTSQLLFWFVWPVIRSVSGQDFSKPGKKMPCQCLIGIGEYGYVNAVICCRLIYYRLPKLLDYVTEKHMYHDWTLSETLTYAYKNPRWFRLHVTFNTVTMQMSTYYVWPVAVIEVFYFFLLSKDFSCRSVVN